MQLILSRDQACISTQKFRYESDYTVMECAWNALGTTILGQHLNFQNRNSLSNN